jgi:hypothetical protein
LQTSQGYINRILQHFATKLWNITNFVMLFQAVMNFLSRSKFSLLCKWSICACSNSSKYSQNIYKMYKSVCGIYTISSTDYLQRFRNISLYICTKRNKENLYKVTTSIYAFWHFMIHYYSSWYIIWLSKKNFWQNNLSI